MKIVIEGEPKEIADLVSQLQERHTEIQFINPICKDVDNINHLLNRSFQRMNSNSNYYQF